MLVTSIGTDDPLFPLNLFFGVGFLYSILCFQQQHVPFAADVNLSTSLVHAALTVVI